MTSPQPSTVVLGVRHGEVHNPRGVIYAGLPGYGLSEAGRAQGAALAHGLSGHRVAAVYCSPLERAVQTAEFLSGLCDAPMVTDDRLIEWKYWSEWGGLTWEELRERKGDEFAAYLEDPGSLTRGETIEVLADRVQDWLDEVRGAHAGGLVIGVSHLEPLRAILVRLTGGPWAGMGRILIPPGQAVRLQPDPSPQPAPPGHLISPETGGLPHLR
ncbi:MAG TPA: histidine phosphatase family protein [Actinomycetota bacterium]|nr:histidine phosphatase family protein [Actinomycetota bacterium]